MNARLFVVAAAALLLASACTQKRIPGTQIADNDDTRAIIALVETYRDAVEGRDTDRLVGLVSSRFRDNAGTSTPEDDLDRGNLEPTLRQRFSRIDKVRLDVDIRTLEVKNDAASAVFYYTLRYELPGLSDKIHTASELKRMDLVREEGQWRILSGI